MSALRDRNSLHSFTNSFKGTACHPSFWKIGDSLRASIEYGLANSRYGVVIASKNFLAKRWPVQELNGLWARESSGKHVILPVWHNITAEEMGRVSPMLADRFAVASSSGIDAVAQKIIDVLDAQ